MLCWTLSQTSALARITGGLRVREKVGVHYSYVRYPNDEVTHCLTLTMTLSSIYLSWNFRNSGLQKVNYNYNNYDDCYCYRYRGRRIGGHRRYPDRLRSR